MLADSVMLKSDPNEIGPETPLFGPGGPELDSLDALQIIIAVEKKFGIRIGDQSAAREALQSLEVLHGWIVRKMAEADSDHGGD